MPDTLQYRILTNLYVVVSSAIKTTHCDISYKMCNIKPQ